MNQILTEPYDLDEPLLDLVRRDGIPRFIVYRPTEVMIVLGRGSNPETELILKNCLQDGVWLMRRRGGGCSVVLDPGNIIVSVVLPAKGIGRSPLYFDVISHWLTNTLKQLGYPGIIRDGISDLVLDGRKVGGSCIYRERGLLYYTTTLLIEPDINLMERYLTHPPREPDYRQGRTHRDFVTSLSWGDHGKPDDVADVDNFATRKLSQELTRTLQLDSLLERLDADL